MQPLADRTGTAAVAAGHRLHSGEHAVVVGGDDLGPGQDPQAGIGREVLEHAGAPCGPTGIEQRAAARGHIALEQHHAQAGADEAPRRGEAGRARTDDEHIGVVVHGLFGAVRCGLSTALRPVEHAETGGPTDRRFEDAFPGPGRPHEGLVVEARAEQRRGQPVDRHQVERQRRPPVLADDAQAFGDLDDGRGTVGRRTVGALDVDEGAGLLVARRDDAARSVILEAAAEEPHALREQRRGDGVASEPLHPAAVELERHRTRGVGEQAGGDATGAAHRSPSGGVSVSVAVPTAWMVWVMVCRQSCRYWRQPAAWYHHS
jgi:hypothetical protein